MSGWTGNGLPPAPRAEGDGVGPAPERRGIVPLRPSDDERRPSLTVPSGLFFCALGGAVASSEVSVVTQLLVGYGFAGVASRGGLREKLLAAALAIVPAALLGARTGVSAVVGAVIACLVALVVAELLVRERMTPGVACVAVAAVAALHLGADEALAIARGTTLSASVSGVIDSYLQQLGGLSVTAAAQARETASALEVMWPSVYVGVALVEVLLARAGVGYATVRIAGDGGRTAPRLPRLADFDVPLWVVAVLVATAAGLAVALTVPSAPRALLVVSANLAMALRFAFAAQGLAVLSWFLGEKGVGTLSRGLIALAALFLEVQFIVLTVVGLVDVWANLRNLARGADPDAQGSA